MVPEWSSQYIQYKVYHLFYTSKDFMTILDIVLAPVAFRVVIGLLEFLLVSIGILAQMLHVDAYPCVGWEEENQGYHGRFKPIVLPCSYPSRFLPNT